MVTHNSLVRSCSSQCIDGPSSDLPYKRPRTPAASSIS